MTVLAIYLGAILLKAVGAPIIREIPWGWFVLAPILALVARLLYWLLCAAACAGMMYLIYRLLTWAL